MIFVRFPFLVVLTASDLLLLGTILGLFKKREEVGERATVWPRFSLAILSTQPALFPCTLVSLSRAVWVSDCASSSHSLSLFCVSHRFESFAVLARSAIDSAVLYSDGIGVNLEGTPFAEFDPYGK